MSLWFKIFDNHNNKNASSRIRSARSKSVMVCPGLVWSGLVWMSYLISLDPLLFKNIAYVGSFKHFVFVFVFVFVITV